MPMSPGGRMTEGGSGQPLAPSTSSPGTSGLVLGRQDALAAQGPGTAAGLALGEKPGNPEERLERPGPVQARAAGNHRRLRTVLLPGEPLGRDVPSDRGPSALRPSRSSRPRERSRAHCHSISRPGKLAKGNDDHQGVTQSSCHAHTCKRINGLPLSGQSSQPGEPPRSPLPSTPHERPDRPPRMDSCGCTLRRVCVCVNGCECM